MPKLESLIDDYDRIYEVWDSLPMIEAYEQMEKLERKITKIRNKIEKLYVGDKSLA